VDVRVPYYAKESDTNLDVPCPFLCDDQQTCLSENQVCDGVSQCPPTENSPGGEDEEEGSGCGELDTDENIKDLVNVKLPPLFLPQPVSTSTSRPKVIENISNIVNVKVPSSFTTVTKETDPTASSVSITEAVTTPATSSFTPTTPLELDTDVDIEGLVNVKLPPSFLPQPTSTSRPNINDNISNIVNVKIPSSFTPVSKETEQNISSVTITEVVTTPATTSFTPTTPRPIFCPFLCDDQQTCLSEDQVCDGVSQCPPTETSPGGEDEEEGSGCGELDNDIDIEDLVNVKLPPLVPSVAVSTSTSRP